MYIIDFFRLIFAFSYISKFYNKILLVNLEKDSFKILKASRKELHDLPKDISFSEWTKIFGNSVNCTYEDHDYFLNFMDLNRLRSLKTSSSIIYKKLIKGVYHDVYLEVLPLKKNRAYIFVKDWSDE